MKTIRSLIVAIPLTLFAACSAESKAAGPATLTADLVDKLAKADALDGTTDKVVHKCAGCKLGMDGKDEFTVTVGDYDMHFCKPACKDLYAKDAVGELKALTVPAK